MIFHDALLRRQHILLGLLLGILTLFTLLPGRLSAAEDFSQFQVPPSPIRSGTVLVTGARQETKHCAHLQCRLTDNTRFGTVPCG